MIRWTDHFDAVYCIHYLPQKEKLGRLMSELNRVGLTDSGILHMKYTDTMSIIDPCVDRYVHDFFGSAGTINLCIATISVLDDARANGWNRILILENDVAFLKDLDSIDRAFSDTPNTCLLQYDRFSNRTDPSRMVKLVSYGETFFGNRFVRKGNARNEFFSGSCYAVKGAATNLSLRKLLDTTGHAPDAVFSRVPNSYVSIVPVAIQVGYSESYSGSRYKSRYMDSLYNVVYDPFVDIRDYNVPDGYDYGAAINKTGNIEYPMVSQEGKDANEMNRYRHYKDVIDEIRLKLHEFPDEVRAGNGDAAEKHLARLYMEAGLSVRSRGSTAEARILFEKASVLAPNSRAPWYQLAELSSCQCDWPLLVRLSRECLKREPSGSVEYRSDDCVMSYPELWGHRPHLLYFIGLAQCGYDSMSDAVMKYLLEHWGEEPEVKQANRVRLDLIEESKYPEGVLK